jgi:hypothetical protein
VARQLVRGTPTLVWSQAVLLGLVVTILVGCSSPPIAPLYTQEELEAIRERHNGWGHPNLLDGFCERR